ncbi:PAS domain S-box protein [Altericroceibacterium spongiae]|uniref:histidine kinase n=1 Tax=Altericroceibacterium spongiae TaxID=2320269 RepID=A0A420EMN6_9SPHN|nr:PAS domain S-box protein [Altericroceibacterium spongiae]RKF21866.1 PAS domain S-box protein [Altericroceibacterium spongiae]
MLEPFDHYAALINGTDDAIIAKDLTGRVLAWNPAAEKMFGYMAEEMVGQPVHILLPPEVMDEEDRMIERVRTGEKVGHFFTRRLHKSGRLLHISMTAAPIRNSAGEITGVTSIMRDATEYLARDNRLRESEARFRMMAENISQLAWIAEADGNIIWYNRRWYDYTGTNMFEMQGEESWGPFLHPDHAQRVRDGLKNCWKSGEEWEDTFPMRGVAGHYSWFLTRAKPIRDGEDRVIYWFGTHTDITEQREQEEQIRLLLMEVNHRSKNMLTTVQALARRSAKDDKGFIARFEDRVRSLAVNQDILVRREWREVPVAELVRLQLSFIEGAAGEFTFDGPECALSPRSAEVIGMALHELATNSLKYGALSADGGHVTIHWECVDGEPDFLIRWEESGGPPVTMPEHHGFGTTLICDVPRHNLGAEVELDYRREGLCWSLKGKCCRID